MFISTFELFKVGIGPSSSHTLGPMLAAKHFTDLIKTHISNQKVTRTLSVRCTLKGSLALTGKGHATDRAVCLGLHGYLPKDVLNQDVDSLIEKLFTTNTLSISSLVNIRFSAEEDIIFDSQQNLIQHPNGMIFELLDTAGNTLCSETYFSIGGGFIKTLDELSQQHASFALNHYPYPFDSANTMLEMANDGGLSIADMKRHNEKVHFSDHEIDAKLDNLWHAMQTCLKRGLHTQGILPGGLNLKRRAHHLFESLQAQPDKANLNDWLCAYAMAVNEENAAGHMVVTAPTNGAAGVIPSALYYFVKHYDGTLEQIRTFLLTASAIGGIIKHCSSISGAEVGCQGEVGAASAMAAAGLCAAQGGTPQQIENAAEIALEHHLGLTCDPVKGLVQVPCIERNGFGAIKAYTAASLSLHSNGQHFMPLDNCISAMKQTGLEMSHKYKETSLGGLAVSIIEC